MDYVCKINQIFFLPCLDAVKMKGQIWSHLYNYSDIDFDDVDYCKHYYSHLIKQIIVNEYDVFLEVYKPISLASKLMKRAFATNLLLWKWHYDAFVKILRDMVSYMLMR